ncbi:MAG: hypothetical protein H7338_22695 [Candidatus Sericytochromatia bacterium]|nr:hypothetical protein [Candidatus Sericytochromatia bacterium]
MSFKRLLTAPLLASCVLLSACPRFNNVPPPLPPPVPQGKEAFANVISRTLNTPQFLLVLRQMGLSPNDIVTYEKSTSLDGRLDDAELRDALDLNAYNAEEITRFFTKGPDTNQTLSSDKLPLADLNGDKRITRDEWIVYSHLFWLTKLKSPDGTYQSKVVMLWSRPEMSKSLEMLAPRLFSIIDADHDNVLTGDEVAAYTGVASAKTFEASQQGKVDLVDPILFTRMLQRGQGTFVRKANEMFIRLDKPPGDGLVSKNELAQGANDPANDGIPGVIQLQKETAGRLEFEKAILRAADNNPKVQKALVKMTWPELLPDP